MTGIPTLSPADLHAHADGLYRLVTNSTYRSALLALEFVRQDVEHPTERAGLDAAVASLIAYRLEVPAATAATYLEVARRGGKQVPDDDAVPALIPSLRALSTYIHERGDDLDEEARKDGKALADAVHSGHMTRQDLADAWRLAFRFGDRYSAAVAEHADRLLLGVVLAA